MVDNFKEGLDKFRDSLDEICENCGRTKGEHHAGTQPWPYDYCPGPGRMDWENGPGTTFKGSGKYKEED